MAEVTISPFQAGDIEGVVGMLNRVLTRDPITSEIFQRKVLLDLSFDPQGAPVARDGDKVVGFMLG
ncbi:MAG TPA: GNAT family N-acetyltransferase, partial [Armatimonadota bacterium]|nr:GNAT family N-acetyltransferase [Armatimonadota bacterium]